MTGRTIAWCIQKARSEEETTAELLEEAEERLNDFMEKHRSDEMTDEETEEARRLERTRRMWLKEHSSAEAALRELERQDFR